MKLLDITIGKIILAIGMGTACQHLKIGRRETSLNSTFKTKAECLVKHTIVIICHRCRYFKETDMNRVGIVFIESLVAHWERTFEQCAFVHKCYILEHKH